MRPTVHELHNSGQYVLIESFSIDEMNQFVVRELGLTPVSDQQPGPRTWKRWLFPLVMGALGAVTGYYGVTLLKGSSSAGVSVLWQLGAAVIGLFVLLPIHELIHGLAFNYVGAPKVGYGYSLKGLMVYAYSHLFPTTMREVALVAIMPFVVITGGLVIGWGVWPDYKVVWAILLLIHTSACIGDFALVKYYRRNRYRTIYTYDDVEVERRSYFFAEV